MDEWLNGAEMHELEYQLAHGLQGATIGVQKFQAINDVG